MNKRTALFLICVGIVAGLGLGRVVPAHAQATPPAAVQAVEYNIVKAEAITVSMPAGEAIATDVRRLDEAGAKGWVVVGEKTFNGTTSHYVLMRRRP